MGHHLCCVVNCGNTSRNSKCKFHAFPVTKWKINQRNAWIRTVKRKNVDGFGIHRTTVSRIFHSVLQDLAATTADFVFWPSKSAVQATMPQCFYPHYSDTRVIIDCTEFKIDIPTDADNRVFCYSHYKKSFTAKVLIVITPGGFICLKSRVAGGRKSDSQMTIEIQKLTILPKLESMLRELCKGKAKKNS